MNQNQAEPERVIFVEFWPGSRRLRPFEVVTEVAVSARSGRPAYTTYHWYDCAAQKDGTIIYDMSGSGGLVDGACYVTRGPWWAARGLGVRHQGERRIARLPVALRKWPPENSVEAAMVECPTCGWLSDEDFTGSGYEPICPHMRWDPADEKWVLKEVAY